MENVQTPARKRAIIIGIIAIIAVALLIIAGFLYKTYQNGKTLLVIPVEEKAKEVTGTLLVSMVPKEIIGGHPLSYAIEPSKNIFTPLYKYAVSQDGLYIYHTALSPDKTKYVTGGMPTTSDLKNATDFAGLYSGKFDERLVDIKKGGPVASFGKSVHSRGQVLRLPSINNKGEILYSTPKGGEETSNFNSEIRYNASGTDYQVAEGLYPRWVSDTVFVYLTTAGLRIHNFTDNSDLALTSITNSDGSMVKMQPNMMMNVSRDGNQIALSNPEDYKIFLYKKVENRYVRNKVFSGFAFWPTFSPDGKMLAGQNFLLSEKEELIKSPQIEFWDIEKEVPTLLPTKVDLSIYNNDMLFVTDWY
jgi:WD40 repeat protein